MLKKLIAIFYLLFIVTPAMAAENFIDQLNRAQQLAQPRPHYSQAQPKANLTEAYRIQKQYVQLRQKTDPIAGYKAGLTSIAGQKKFNLSGPLSGVLFASGRVSAADDIKRLGASKLMLETEIGFILSEAIELPVNDITELKTKVSALVAVIELPDLGYATPGEINGVDLAAANLASHQYLLGESVAVDKINEIDQLTTRLSKDGAPVFSGKATDAMNGQWLALQWMVNHLLSQGYQLEPGNLLITGALGKMVAAESGQYSADFDQLGQLEFTIK